MITYVKNCEEPPTHFIHLKVLEIYLTVLTAAHAPSRISNTRHSESNLAINYHTFKGLCK